MKSEPIQFNSVGNLLVCTRCGQHATGDAVTDLKEHTILYAGRVPVAILCDSCWLELEVSGDLDEEHGTVRLYNNREAASVGGDFMYHTPDGPISAKRKLKAKKKR